jgi:hypothetical protein
VSLWERKPGPVWRWSRLMHFVLAFGLTGYGGHLAGDAGCAYGAGVAVLGGLAWELASPWLPGDHPHADLWDFITFLLGACFAAVGWATVGVKPPS